jgi:hypothetical protein
MGRPAQRSAPDQEWELNVRPKWMARWAVAIALLVFATSVVLAVLLRSTHTGVYFRLADQIAMVGIGAVIAGCALLLTRPRLRVGSQGVSVRNALGEKLIPWRDVVALTFPKGSSWARVDLPDYEYVPVLALQARDKHQAAVAVEKFRELEARYRH